MSDITDQAVNMSGEETGRDEFADDAEQATEDVDLTGFDDDTDDGSDSEANNSIDETEDEKAKENSSEENSRNNATGRAEKRDRTANGRIQEVIAQRQAERSRAEAAEAELAKFREQAKQAELAKQMPQADEDGDYNANDLIAYQQQIANRAKEEAVEQVRAEMAAERQEIAANNMIGESEQIWDKAVRENPILKDEKISESVRVRAVQAAAPYVERRDFANAAKVLESTIAEDVAMLKASENYGRTSRAQSLDSLRDNSALVSANTGRNDRDDDPQFAGWDDD